MAEVDYLAEDFNGDCFKKNATGEEEVQLFEYMVFIPWADDAVKKFDDPFTCFKAMASSKKPNDVGSEDQRKKARNLMYNINVAHLRCMVANAEDLFAPGYAKKSLYTNKAIEMIAFFRLQLCMMDLQLNLFSASATPADNYCSYTDIQFVGACNGDMLDALDVLIAGVDRAALFDDACNNAVYPKKSDRKFIKENMCNSSSLVAYMMRARGHHMLEEMKPRYNELWNKICRPNVTYPLDWELVAGSAIHFVFPAVLDKFYVYCCDNGLVDGSLQLRVNVAGAGTAALHAVKAGWDDLSATFPQVNIRFKSYIEKLNADILKCQANRWDYTVNAGLYGAAIGRLEEAYMGSMASSIVAIGRAISSEDEMPLLKSKSLQRTAKNAPITGTLLALAVQSFIKDQDRVVAIMDGQVGGQMIEN